MQARLCILDEAIVNTRPAPETSDAAVELAIYVEGGDNLILLMNEDKGQEIVQALAKQLDKIADIARSRKEAQKRMLDSMVALSGKV